MAKALEEKLFQDGKVVYFLGIGNVLYGVDADIERKQENRLEHMRRLAEVANLMLDAGIILVVAAAELRQDDLEVIKTAVQPDWIETVWAGDTITTDLSVDLQLPGGAIPEAVDRLKAHLRTRESSSAHGERQAAVRRGGLVREAGQATMTYYDAPRRPACGRRTTGAR